MNTYLLNIENALQDTFAQGLADIAQKVHCLNPSIKVVSSHDDVSKVLALRQSVYPDLYPESQVHELDEFDYYSILLFTEDTEGKAMSCCRLVLDNPNGFVEEASYAPFIKQFRQHNQKLLECGRCIVTTNSSIRAVDYLNVIQNLALTLKVAHILMFNRQKDVYRLLANVNNIKVLTSSDKKFGGKQKFSAMLWTMVTNQPTIYEKNVWDDYAYSFMTVTTSFQSELLTQASKYLYGNVIDCGAGCAKIAPYLKHHQKIISYTGVDACLTMCQLGEKVLKKVNKPSFKMMHTYIEHLDTNILYDSAVSINSLYTWQNPTKVLAHIYNLLKSGGVLVLANVNINLDINQLVKQVEADLLMHPDADIFHTFNLRIADNQQAHRYSLNDLIAIVQQAGFMVKQCHDSFFNGGVSFLLLTKP